MLSRTYALAYPFYHPYTCPSCFSYAHTFRCAHASSRDSRATFLHSHSNACFCHPTPDVYS
ncbi:MAG: hypothetical protein HY533_04540 [Chloroflexi bacterium]|nr:hypothetical protein [Chloroflexota bacterium]